MEYGSISREALDKCLKTQTRKRIDKILIALNGSLSEHQCSFFRMIFGHLEALDQHRYIVEDAILGSGRCCLPLSVLRWFFMRR